jgi:RNA polymerase sigma factor
MQKYITDEIESFKQELAKWNITMDALATQSPKHIRLRNSLNQAADILSENVDVIQKIFTKQDFPIKEISNLTKMSKKKIENGRTFILAALIIRNGEYEHLKNYLT